MIFNRLNRRKFLKGVTVVGLATIIGTIGLIEKASSSVAFGKMQVGLNGVYDYSLIMPFINQWKNGREIQVIAGGTNYFSSTAPGNALTPWGVYLDTNGELLSVSLPANVTHLLRIIYTQPPNGLPPGYPGRTGQSWVLKWDGDPALTVVVPLSSIVRVGSRLTGDWTDNTSNKTIELRSFDVANPPRNIRFCRADYEAFLDAGEIFSPDYAEQLKRGSGVVRFMDWQLTNNNRVNLSYSGLPTEAYFTWGSTNTAVTGINGGMPLSVMSKFANKVRSHPWVCIPGPFGTEKLCSITGVSQANPPVVTAPGHNFINGDEAIAYRISGMIKTAIITMTIASPCVVTWTGNDFVIGSNITFSGGTLPTGIVAGQSYFVLGTGDSFQIARTPGGAAVVTSGTQLGVHTGTAQLNRNKFTVQNVVAGVSFELTSTNTTTYSAYSSEGWFTSPFSLSRMTTEMTLFATHFRDNVTPVLISRFQYSNETWNAGLFDVFHWLAAQAHNFLNGSNVQIFPGDDGQRLEGYLGSHFMKVVRDVYGVQNRAKWQGIIGTQLVNTGVTNSVLAGITQYITDQAPTLVITDLFNDIAFTGYYGGGNLVANNSQGTPGLSLSVTIDTSTDVFTATNHGYRDRNPLKFTGTMPSPLVVGTIYYARDTTTSTFKIALTPGGATIDLSGSVGSNTVICAMGDWSLDVINTSISRFNSGLETTRYSYFIRIITEDDVDSRYTGQPFSMAGVLVYWTAQKAIADSNGLTVTEYEAGFGADVAAFVAGPNAALYLEFFPQLTNSAENGANTRLNAENFIAFGGHHPSQFTDAAAPSNVGGFGALPYIGAASSRWDAVVDVTNKSLGMRP